MNVKELIEELKKFDPSLEVTIFRIVVNLQEYSEVTAVTQESEPDRVVIW